MAKESSIAIKPALQCRAARLDRNPAGVGRKGVDWSWVVQAGYISHEDASATLRSRDGTCEQPQRPKKHQHRCNRYAEGGPRPEKEAAFPLTNPCHALETYLWAQT